MESRFNYRDDTKKKIITNSTAFALVSFAALYTASLAVSCIGDYETNAQDTAYSAASIGAADFFVRFLTDDEHGLISYACQEIPKAWNHLTNASRSGLAFFNNSTNPAPEQQKDELNSEPSPAFQR